jgi:hypothetical protein
VTTAKQPFEIVNEIGHAAYAQIEREIQANEVLLEDAFSAALMACCISLADALAPTVASSKEREKAAQLLVELCMKRVRELLAPAGRGKA